MRRNGSAGNVAGPSGPRSMFDRRQIPRAGRSGKRSQHWLEFAREVGEHSHSPLWSTHVCNTSPLQHLLVESPSLEGRRTAALGAGSLCPSRVKASELESGLSAGDGADRSGNSRDGEAVQPLVLSGPVGTGRLLSRRPVSIGLEGTEDVDVDPGHSTSVVSRNCKRTVISWNQLSE